MDNYEMSKEYMKWCTVNEQSPSMREETVFVCGYNAAKRDASDKIERLRTGINELLVEGEVLKKVAEIVLSEIER